MHRVLLRRIRGLAFLSGMCALVYQIMWMRHLRLIFGASTAASAAVIAIFMGGLGVGAAWLGRRADRVDSPLYTYGNLELGVAGAAAVTPVLVEVARMIYAGVGGSQSLGPVGSLVTQLVLATLVLGGPCMLMGATLPTLARTVSTGTDRGRSELGYIYAINTLGAVLGSFIGTFALLEILGVRTSILCFAGLNAIIGLLARGMARGSLVSTAPVVAETSGAPSEDEDAGHSSEASREVPTSFVYAASGVVGFAFFVMEIVWYRMFAPLLGGSAYSFGLILTMALLGIGLGSWAYGFYGRSRRPTRLTFALTCGVEALLMAVPFFVGDDLAAVTLVSRGLQVFGFSGLVTSWALLTALVVLPPAIVAGFQFPLLVGLLGVGRRSIASQVGAAYLANTIGSILGALGSGFGLLVLLGAPRLWVSTVALLVLVSVVATLLALRARETRRRLPVVLSVTCVVVTAMLLSAEGPTAAWRHAPTGAGRVGAAVLRDANAFEQFRRKYQTDVVWEADGRESSVAIKGSNGYSFAVSGKTDGHAYGDFATVVMCPLIGAMLHPEPRRGLVIGLGTGTSAGWLAEVPTMERVDVVEFEPAIIEVARVSAPVNHNVLEHPRVQLIIGDGREVLMTSSERYDVVMSEPSNPYRAGIASLYSADFYRAAFEKMSDDGVFVQWLQGYEIDPRTFEAAVTTLRSVFPAVEVWLTNYRGDLALVAFKSSEPYSLELLKERVEQPMYRRALAKGWGVTGVPGFLSGFVMSRDVTTTIMEDNLNFVDTDDLPVLEFGFARNVGVSRKSMNRDALVEFASARDGGLSALDGFVDPLEVREAVDARANGTIVEARLRPLDPSSPEEARAAAREAYGQGRYDEMLSRWASQPVGIPVHPRDAVRLAHAAAELGAPEVPELASLLSKDFPTTLAMTRALRAVRFEDPDTAVLTVEAAFAALREDPFVTTQLAWRVFGSLEALVDGRPDLALRVDEALARPFSIRRFDLTRREVRLRVSRALLDPRRCAEAASELEPSFPWAGDLLQARRDCYVEIGDARAELAERELAAFRAGDGQP